MTQRCRSVKNTGTKMNLETLTNIIDEISEKVV